MTNDSESPPRGRLLVSMDGGPSVVPTQYLPVEVRDVSSARVTRGILGKPVNLRPGSYWVSAKLPDGEVLESEAPIDVAPGVTATAVLQPLSPAVASSAVLADAAAPSSISKLATGIREKVDQLDDAPPWLKALLRPLLLAAFEKTLGLLGVQVPASLRSQGSGELGWVQGILSTQLRHISQFDTLSDLVNSLATPSGPQARFVAASWDIRSGEAAPKPIPAPRQSKLVVGPVTMLFASSEGQFIQVASESEGCLVVAVPSEGNSRTVVTCSMENPASGNSPVSGEVTTPPTLKIDFYFSDSDTNALFQYMAQGDFLESRAMAAAIIESSTEPSGAASPTKLALMFAAYVQLRENRLEKLDIVLEHLAKEWPSSPDVAAARMEACARRGNHADAAALCASVPTLGIPVMSSGIAYLQQRTRQFLDSVESSDAPVGTKGFSLTPQLAGDLEKTWRMVTPLGAGLDSRTIVTAIRLPRPYRA